MKGRKLRFIIDTQSIRLKEDNDKPVTSVITVLREGTWKHRLYGVISATRELFASFINNFKKQSIGKDIAVNLGHDLTGGAAGWFKDVFVEGKRLRALIEWTPLGVEKIKNKEFRYISAEYKEEYEHPETGENLGGVLLGAALCISPFVGGMDAVELSASAAVNRQKFQNVITVFHPDICGRKALANSVEAKIEEDKTRQEVNEAFWAAENLISEVLRDKDRTADQKRADIEKVVDDFLAILEKGGVVENNNKQLSGGVMKDKYLKRLQASLLAVVALSEGFRNQLLSHAEKIITGDESEEEIDKYIAGQVKLAEGLAEDAKKLGAAAPDQALQTKILSAEDIQKLVAEGIANAKKAEADQAKKLSDQKETNVRLLAEEIKNAEGIGDDDKKLLSEGLVKTITGNESEEQIKAMAAAQVQLAEKQIADRALVNMGFPVRGYVNVADDEADKGVKQLSENIDKKIMRYEEMPDSERFFNTGALSKINEAAAKKVLSLYDRVYARELAMEAMKGKIMLTGGEIGIGDTSLPYTVVRTSVREAMYNLVAAQFVGIGTETGEGGAVAPTVFIPVVKRQAGNPSIDNITVYEGQAIPDAGMEQSYEMAYTNQRKLAILFSDEVAFFTRASRIDYDAVRDGMNLVTRMIAEGVERLLLTEIVMAADEYSVVSISSEDLASQTDAVNTTFQLAQWPLCKPRKVYDLQGNQVGSTINPITVTYLGSAIQEYDGSGTQTAGNYYTVTSWTLGQFQIVNETGAVQTPGAADALTVSYSYTTNVVKWDKNFTTGTWGDHLNNFLNLFGRRKAALGQDRYSIPNYALMSMVLNNMFTEASKFEASKRIEGQGLTGEGNLARVKGIPCFGSNVPFPMMADQRLIIGEKFVTKQKIVRPWTVDPNFTNAVDANGKFIGKKKTYGQQYDAVHTPALNKGKSTEIAVYDSTTDIGPF